MKTDIVINEPEIRIQEVGDKLVVDKRAREWCKLPYPNHSKGCPNYGKKTTCPPCAPLVQERFDLSKPMWLVCARFDIAAQEARMLSQYPDWSKAQARNSRYWQAGIRKVLRSCCEAFKLDHPGTVYTDSPEAMGIQVIKTARNVGIPILPRPKDIVWKIALIGYPNEATCAGKGLA